MSVLVLADALPNDDGYVVAAYLVFLALLLIYLTIMAIRLSRVERDLVELNQETEPRA
jgi:hypothetical protein